MYESGVVAYQGQGVKSFRVALLFEHHPQLGDLRLLLFRQMPRMTRFVRRRNCRVVVVVILGIEGEFRHIGRTEIEGVTKVFWS